MEQVNADGPREEQRLLASDSVSYADEAPSNLFHLALRLIAELSACVQRVSSDLAQAQAGERDELESAHHRWAQQLRALAAVAEGNLEGAHATSLPSETPLSALPPYPRHNATTQPITLTTRVPVASSDAAPEPSSQEMPINPPLPASFRWVPLTAREREVLKLTQKGYPPRRIATRLIIEVETVYTHLRNIRRKQREWERAHQAQGAQQAQRGQQLGQHEERERLNPATPTPPTPKRRRMRIAPTQW